MSELQYSFGGVRTDAFPQILDSILSLPARKDDVLCKQQIENIATHLKAINAVTTVIETNYVDHDFMDDYSAYYARCFNQYERFCTRLHFFSSGLGEDEIRNGVVKNNKDFKEKITSSYLGFVVLRPLPLKVIGRTCLLPCKKGDLGYVKSLCTVSVSFFGYDLSVECMPFQEQDKIVAACATSALWSSFYVTAKLFGHSTITPSKITAVAKERGASIGRAIPNRYGLTAVEMAYAIRHIGLEVVSVNISDLVFQQKYAVLGNIYAYLNLGVPLLLMGDLISLEGKKKGKHAMAVNGFRFLEGEHRLPTLPANRVYACRIKEIYVNDDGIGPYAKMTVPEKVKKGINEFVFESLWREKETCRGNALLFKPSMILVPIYARICVSYDDVWSVVYDFDRHLMYHMSKIKIEWEIVLEIGKRFKQQIHKMDGIDTAEKQNLLLSGLPKYLWIVKLYVKDQLNSVFCIDATDARQGLSIVFAICYTDEVPRIASTFKKEGYFIGRPNAICDACCQLLQKGVEVA